MLFHIANLQDTERYSAVAAADLPMGAVVQFTPAAGGGREATLVTAGTQLKNGMFGVAFKVSADPEQVTESTVPASWGSRVVEIETGDDISVVMPGAILEYDVSLLHASLDPNRAGALPAVGADLEVLNGLWCAVAQAGIASPVVGRVMDVFGGNKVQIALVPADTIA